MLNAVQAQDLTRAIASLSEQFGVRIVWTVAGREPLEPPVRVMAVDFESVALDLRSPLHRAIDTINQTILEQPQRRVNLPLTDITTYQVGDWIESRPKKAAQTYNRRYFTGEVMALLKGGMLKIRLKSRRGDSYAPIQTVNPTRVIEHWRMAPTEVA